MEKLSGDQIVEIKVFREWSNPRVFMADEGSESWAPDLALLTGRGNSFNKRSWTGSYKTIQNRCLACWSSGMILA